MDLLLVLLCLMGSGQEFHQIGTSVSWSSFFFSFVSQTGGQFSFYFYGGKLVKRQGELGNINSHHDTEDHRGSDSVLYNLIYYRMSDSSLDRQRVRSSILRRRCDRSRVYIEFWGNPRLCPPSECATTTATLSVTVPPGLVVEVILDSVRIITGSMQ